MNYLTKSTETALPIVPYARENALALYENKEQQIYRYGFNSVVVITPIVEEWIARGAIEPLACCLFSSLGIAQASLISTFVTSLGFGILYYCNYSKKDGLEAAACNFCYSLIKNSFGLPVAIIAHSLKNFSDYKTSEANWEKLKSTVFTQQRKSEQKQSAPLQVIVAPEKLDAAKMLREKRQERRKAARLAIEFPQSETPANIKESQSAEQKNPAPENSKPAKKGEKAAQPDFKVNEGFNGMRNTPLLLLPPP
jgi:hypothetical protein